MTSKNCTWLRRLHRRCQGIPRPSCSHAECTIANCWAWSTERPSNIQGCIHHTIAEETWRRPSRCQAIPTHFKPSVLLKLREISGQAVTWLPDYFPTTAWETISVSSLPLDWNRGTESPVGHIAGGWHRWSCSIDIIRPVGGVRHSWSVNSVASTAGVVWSRWTSSSLVHVVLERSHAVCQMWLSSVRYETGAVRRTTRICSWTYSLFVVYSWSDTAGWEPRPESTSIRGWHSSL